MILPRPLRVKKVAPYSHEDRIMAHYEIYKPQRNDGEVLRRLSIVGNVFIAPLVDHRCHEFYAEVYASSGDAPTSEDSPYALIVPVDKDDERAAMLAFIEACNNYAKQYMRYSINSHLVGRRRLA